MRTVRLYIAEVLSTAVEDITLSVLSETISLEHSLDFVKRTRWHDQEQRLLIQYSINGY